MAESVCICVCYTSVLVGTNLFFFLYKMKRGHLLQRVRYVQVRIRKKWLRHGQVRDDGPDENVFNN